MSKAIRSDVPLQTMTLSGTAMFLQTPHRCRFLELPVELRDPIYHYVFLIEPDERGYVAISKHSYSSSRNSVLSLLATCHQINAEAISIFYTINNFHLPASALRPLHIVSTPVKRIYIGSHHRHGPAGFLTVTSAARLEAIHALRATVESVEEATMACNQVRRLANLRTFELVFKHVSLDYGDFHNHGDLHFLKRAIAKLQNIEHFKIEDARSISENAEYREEWKRWTREVVDMLPRARRSGQTILLPTRQRSAADGPDL